jgi:hypothetical protein
MVTAAALEVTSVQGPLDLCSLHVVNSLDTLDQCRRWLSERRDGPLAVDTESGGL